MPHKAKTTLSPLNIDIDGYVTVNMGTKHIHKQQSKQKEPLRVTEPNKDLVIVLRNVHDASTLLFHAQRMGRYHVSRRIMQAWVELKQQTAIYLSVYYLVKYFLEVWKADGEFEVLTKWLDSKLDQDETWKTIGTVKSDMSGALKSSIHTMDDWNL